MKVRLTIDLELPEMYEKAHKANCSYLCKLFNDYYIKAPANEAYCDNAPNNFVQACEKAKLSFEVRQSSGYTLEEFR